MLVFAAFGLKLVIVAAVARGLRPRCSDDLGAALSAWVVVTGLGFAAMMAVSAASLLAPAMFWSMLAGGAAIALVALRRGCAIPEFLREARPVLVIFGAFWLVLAARSLLFQDFTWDAQTYGLARIAIWMNYGTLFVHMPTPLINVFVNEWNGELMGLFYGLAAGDLQGPIFANVEVLLIVYLACAWLARLVGASWNWAFAIAALAALCPACLGLATTVKGDLLAAAAFAIAVGWFMQLRSGPTTFAASMLVACLALAMGAKIMAPVVAATLGVASLVVAGPRVFLAARTLWLGGFFACVFLARYLANIFVYGNPIHRPSTEVPEPGLATFIANLDLIWRSSHSFSMHEPGAPQLAWHLAAGLGVVGIALLGAVVALLLARRRVPLLVLGILAAGLLLSCTAIPARIYGFRYFLPAILAGAVIVLALAEPRRNRIAIAAVLLLASINASYLAWPGEINANGSFARAFREQIGRSPIERALLASEGHRRLVKFDEFRFDRPEPLSIAIFQDFDRAILPFVGSRAQNRLYLAASPGDLPNLLRDKRPDFAVVMKRSEYRLPAPLRDAVSKAGFTWVAENEVVGIAARSDRAEARAVRPESDPELPEMTANSPILVRGAYGSERHEGINFRWLHSVVRIDVPLSGGEACIALTVFGTGRPENPQIVKVEGAAVEPPAFDLAQTNIGARKTVVLRMRASGSIAQLRLIATMPVTRWPNDGRSIAFGMVIPPRSVPIDACR